MPTITVPAATEHPERWSVVQLLLKAGEPVGRVVRLIGPGDPAAERDRTGTPRETALFLTGRGEPRTAIFLDGDRLRTWAGWGDEPKQPDPA